MAPSGRARHAPKQPANHLHRRPDSFRLICQWAALHEVDATRIAVAGREPQLQHLAAELGGNKHPSTSTVAKLVEEHMRTRIASALGWTTTAAGGTKNAPLKPARQRAWPPWTKGWLRDDWDGCVDEPDERTKRRIARWWAGVQRRDERRRDDVEGRGGADDTAATVDGDGDGDYDEEDEHEHDDHGADDDAASDVNAAVRSQTTDDCHQTAAAAADDDDSSSFSDSDSDHGGGPQRDRQTTLDSLLQRLFPDDAAAQDLMMETLAGGGAGRYDWLE